MKKFFTSLLALAGMVVGFTLTSCGGGGGGGDALVNIAGLEIEGPAGLSGFTMEVTDRISGDLYSARYFGMEGRFSVTSVNGSTVTGYMWLNDSSEASTSTDLAQWFGLNVSHSGLSITSEGGNPVTLSMQFKSEKEVAITRAGSINLFDEGVLRGTVDLKDGSYRSANQNPDPDDVIDDAETEYQVYTYTVSICPKGILELL